MQKAQLFERPDDGTERNYILQIVSSYSKGPKTNLHEVLLKPEHPYLRLICKKDADLQTDEGDVLEFGYWPKKYPDPLFKNVPGCFRSPDKWEYSPREESVVTSIPLSKEEMAKVIRFTRHYQSHPKTPLRFHTAYQNCTSYIRTACFAAGIIVPTKIEKTDLVAAIMPSRIQTIGRALSRACTCAIRPFSALYHYLPRCITTPLTHLVQLVTLATRCILSWFLSFCLLPARAAVGDAQGEVGRELDPIHALVSTADVEEEAHIAPPLTQYRRWFTFFAEPMNLPSVLQKWQREQASTHIFSPPGHELSITIPSDFSG